MKCETEPMVICLDRDIYLYIYIYIYIYGIVKKNDTTI